jgi:hypothetical protein
MFIYLNAGKNMLPQFSFHIFIACLFALQCMQKRERQG